VRARWRRRRVHHLAGVDADNDAMILLWIVAAVLGALGLMLAGFGVGSIVDGTAFDTAVYVGVSALFLYPAYLFGRAALRIQRNRRAIPATPTEEKIRRTRTTKLVAMVALMVVGIVVAPVPGALKVVMTLITVLAVALNLAVADEPSRKRRTTK
jgi:hypothetical protein